MFATIERPVSRRIFTGFIAAVAVVSMTPVLALADQQAVRILVKAGVQSGKLKPQSSLLITRVAQVNGDACTFQLITATGNLSPTYTAGSNIGGLALLGNESIKNTGPGVCSFDGVFFPGPNNATMSL